MKKSLLLIVISSLFFSCKKSNLEQVWIGKYCYEANDSTYQDACPRKIYAFKKDSVSIKEFYFQITDDEDNSTYKYPYKIEQNKLFVFKRDRIDSVAFDVKKDLYKRIYPNGNEIA